MAEIFISYRRTPTRRLIVRRLALIFRASELSVWCDSGLESGREFAEEIYREISNASVVMPLWCTQSVRSEWVLREAALGAAKLHPVMIQRVTPPAQYASIHACDLTAWDGDARNSSLTSLIGDIKRRLGRDRSNLSDMADELASLPKLDPLPNEDPLQMRVLQKLRRAYLDWDSGIDLEDALALNLDTPIEDFLGDGSASELLETYETMCSHEGNDYLAVADDYEALLDEERMRAVRTIGDLVCILIARRAELGEAWS